ncbi:TonB-dependent receptor [Xanthomonas translucens]|uniref:TonB-dependent receptor n=1 Tax=Xanthomonas campestris pv. translucens TaxID=343 RepID=UPI00071E946E|nr:TonB-dependent receptor [Xanthomonas translucens]QEN94565.1 TonB-dependent receptor [Xanthomonas translucens pv. undulosa]
MQHTRPIDRLTCAIALALTLSTPAFADALNERTTTLDSVNVQADQAPAPGSINEQRLSASVNSVMDKQQLDAVPSAGIADVVAHMPGLSAYSDMHLGQATTGENAYVSIRGMDASYNAYTLNGFGMPETDSSTRAISLNMLAPFGIQSVQVSKAPTPDMPGDAVGGAIDMRTPSAFDFDGDFHGKTTAQGQFSELASDLGGKDMGGTLQQELAWKFGDNQAFGLYASAYYGKNNNMAQAPAPNSKYVPLDPAQANASDLRDVGPLVSTRYKYSVYTSQIERYGGNLALDWQGEHSALYARAIYGSYAVTGQQDQSSARLETYLNQPTAVRGGYFNTHDIEEKLATLQLGGQTTLDRLHFDYGSSSGRGTRSRPDYISASLYGFTPGSFAFDLSDPTYPGIGPSSDALKNYFYNLDSSLLWKVQGHDAGSHDNRLNAHTDISYRVDGDVLDSVKVGLAADHADRGAYDHPFFHKDGNFLSNGPYFGGPNYAFPTAGGPPLSAIPGRTTSGAFDGHYAGPFKILDRNWMLAQALPYKYVNDPKGAGVYTANDYNANTTSSTEAIYSGYAMATLHFGAVTVLPGVRYELTRYSADSWQSSGDGSNGQFVSNGRTYGEVLPGISLNYRPDDLTVYRASLRRSFSRPAFGLISGETVYTIAPNNTVLGISKPNPDLNPSKADNADLSAEFYDHNGGVLSAATYYKRISGFIYTSQSATSNDNTLGGLVPTGTTFENGVPVTMPQNGGSAKLYGLELAASKRLQDLPGIWSNVGVTANLTLQHSEADSKRADQPDRTWLPRAPQRIYNLDLFYDDSKLRADLSYNYTGLQLLGLTSDRLNYYLQPVKSLDFNATYHLPHGIDVGVSAKNLLNAATFYETQGKSTRYMAYDPGADGAYVETGRVYMLTLGYTY